MKSSQNTTPRQPEVCEYCGAPLTVVHRELLGRTFDVCTPCTCKGAEAARERMLEDRRKARERDCIENAWAAANIPARYRCATIEPTEFEALQAECRKQDRTCIYLYGKVGVGKTWRAVAIVKAWMVAHTATYADCLTHVPRVGFVEEEAYLSAVVEAKAQEQARKTLRNVRGAELLVLDDVGKKTPKDWTVSQLFALVNARYNAMKPLVITSQYSLPELGKRWAASGNTDTAEALVSRLYEMCSVEKMTGVDRRLGA